MITAGRNQGRVHAASARIGLAGARPAGGALDPSRSTALGRFVASLSSPSSSQPRLKPEIWVAVVLLAVSASVFLPDVRSSVGSHSDRVAVSAATTLIGMFAGLLFLGRFWQRQQLRALLIACGLGFIALASLSAQLLLARNVELLGHTAAWIGLSGRLIGWLLIATAALVADRTLIRGDWRLLLTERPLDQAHSSRARPGSLKISTASTKTRARAVRTILIAGTALLTLGLGAYVTSTDPVNSGRLRDPTAVLAVQIVIALVASVTAWMFMRERRHDGNPSLRFLSLAAMFGAAASIAYCATPSLPAQSLGVGDVMRLCASVALLLSISVEWFIDEREARGRALIQERRRIAADVHDLIMQDLSLALATARSIADDPAGAPQASAIVAAGERALAGAREVVNGLSSQDTKPIVEAVEIAARAAARNTRLSFDAAHVPGNAQPDEPTQDSLIHIAREAVTNATKHSRTNAVEVVLAYADEWRLTVRDEGRGFDPDGCKPSRHGRGAGMGFGLESMRQRADALGGSLCVVSAPGDGTTVEAVLP